MTVGNIRRRSLVGACLIAAVLPVAAMAGGTAGAAPQPNVVSHVVGGQRASITDYPFTVFLTTPDGFQFCGGSLVAPNKVVTAAHCTVDIKTTPDQVKVVAGREDKTSSAGQSVDVTSIWVHPDFTDAQVGSDVSILTLAQSLTYQPVPIETDASVYQAGTATTILGWGDTSEGGTPSNFLLKANPPLVADADCASDYPKFNATAMVCAGEKQGGVDTCQGDSGGPLLIDGKLAGITSWGQGCAEAAYPGIYTRVATYAAAIQQQLGS